jgi:PAS domain S-box-containing protein
MRAHDEKRQAETSDGALGFDTGSLTKEEIAAMLNALPVDITFVDTDDNVRYFNKAEERVFPRTKAVIGRKVQMCHPSKSIHIVNKVVENLKTGKKKSADFWIDINERKVLIRYFPVRDQKGEFLGVMEVTQDITEIKKIEGERRLLNEMGSI